MQNLSREDYLASLRRYVVIYLPAFTFTLKAYNSNVVWFMQFLAERAVDFPEESLNIVHFLGNACT